MQCLKPCLDLLLYTYQTEVLPSTSPEEFTCKSNSGNELDSLEASLHDYKLCRQEIC